MSKENKFKAIDNINATMKVENLELTNFERKILEDIANNKISLTQAIEKVKKSVLKKYRD